MRFTASLLLVLCFGCGRASELPYTDHSRDPEAYALDIKRLVLQHVADARRSREPADVLWGVVTELEQHTSRPTGNYAAIYAKMLPLAKEAYQQCEGLTAPPQGMILQRLDELASLANELPGEVTVTTSDEASGR